MKLYIAAANQYEAKKVRDLCVSKGHEVISSWLDEDFSRTCQYTDVDKVRIATKDVAEVLACDAVVLIPSSYRIPGGKFVEVGVAVGAGKRVFILGHRENMLMWHPSIVSYGSCEDFLKYES